MKFLIAVFSISLVCLASGNVEDHLKKVIGKTDASCMRNIDFIYMINLDQRPEKLARSLQQLEKYGIFPYRFSAINAWELSLEELNDAGLKYQAWMASGMQGTCYPPELGGIAVTEAIAEVGKTYFLEGFPIGSAGVCLSHLSVLQDAYDSGYQTIWVMEDDIEVVSDPTKLSDLIDALDALVGKDGWDILFTDREVKGQNGEPVICMSYAPRPDFVPPNPDRFAERAQVGDHFRKVGARYGSCSMVLRRSGMKKLLDFMKMHQLFLAYDMEYTLPNGIRLYTVLSDIVTNQGDAPSDNRAPNYRSRRG